MGINNNKKEDLIMKEDEYEVVEDMDDDVPLPGFRFHPTDEELVSFYLRRKLNNKPITIELIKQIDIYKYDPWDLPRASGSGGDKEGYFFCKRGRKYRNSIRPNRVTGSGFWKATGIDKPVYSHGGEGNDCIGLKKTLVYYRGSAGKGTKTDWMMHEFRLPSPNDTTNNTIASNTKNHHNHNADVALQEAEIWTLCRIFKRNVSARKHTQEMMRSQLASAKRTHHDKIITNNNNNTHHHQESYINFGASLIGHRHSHHHQHQNEEQKPVINNNYNNTRSADDNQRINHQHHHNVMSQFNNNNNPLVMPQQQEEAHNHHHQVQIMTAPCSNNNHNNFWINAAAAATTAANSDFFMFDNWDELGSVVKFAVDSPI